MCASRTVLFTSPAICAGFRTRSAPPRPPPPQTQHPSPRSLRGLDWFVFFVADVQTGFGPFISVYLTTQKWTQTDIGFVLSIGSIVALLGQMPGGADRRCGATRAFGRRRSRLV